VNDAINAAFEALGALLCWRNFAQLLCDREIKGVYWPAAAFWSLWGLWNLWYYPSLGQWLSFSAGVLLCAGNCAWVFVALCLRQS
jgi:hypothetical protein